jgi:hypothetical protein
MESPVLLPALFHEVQQAREAAGVYHLSKRSIVVAAVEQEKVGDNMERCKVVLL